MSGFRGEHAQFGALAEFLRLVREKQIPTGSVLIVENLDRLSRDNLLDACSLFADIIRAGVTVTPKGVRSRETVANDMTKLMVPLSVLHAGARRVPAKEPAGA